jgi:DNA replication protein DnaC
MKEIEKILEPAIKKLQTIQSSKEQTKSTSKDWKKFLPFAKKKIEDAGLDNMLKVFPAMIAKELTETVEDNKGFCVMGGVGCGKSKRMLLFSRLFNIKIITAKEICNYALASSNPFLVNEIVNAVIDKTGLYQKRMYDLVLDDLGDEEENAMIYGNRKDIIRDAIDIRYNLFDYGGGHRTHFTTNLTLAELEERYGDRTFSRLNKMVHFIEMEGKDRRKK